MSRQILVNRAFIGQRVTGQQRYATEIAARLLDQPGFESIEPKSTSILRVWAWVLFVLPRLAWRSVLLSMTARAPVLHPRQVLVVHDLFVLTHPEWFSRKYVITHAPLLKLQLKRAAALAAVSQPVADEIAERYTGRVVVAPNAPSAVFASSDPLGDARVLAGRGLAAGGYLLAVGSLDPRKNLPGLAAAYALLSDDQRAATPLVVVGGGNAIFRGEIIDWPAATIDAGYVTDDELRALYGGAAAVVFASFAEGFGLPLVEAAAARAASLVVSDIPVFRWICGDGAIYVDPTSPQSIAEGMRRALAAPVKIDIDPDRFSWDASASIVGELVQRVAEENR